MYVKSEIEVEIEGGMRQVTSLIDVGDAKVLLGAGAELLKDLSGLEGEVWFDGGVVDISEVKPTVPPEPTAEQVRDSALAAFIYTGVNISLTTQTQSNIIATATMAQLTGDKFPGARFYGTDGVLELKTADDVSAFALAAYTHGAKTLEEYAKATKR